MAGPEPSGPAERGSEAESAGGTHVSRRDRGIPSATDGGPATGGAAAGPAGFSGRPALLAGAAARFKPPGQLGQAALPLPPPGWKPRKKDLASFDMLDDLPDLAAAPASHAPCVADHSIGADSTALPAQTQPGAARKRQWKPFVPPRPLDRFLAAPSAAPAAGTSDFGAFPGGSAARAPHNGFLKPIRPDSKADDLDARQPEEACDPEEAEAPSAQHQQQRQRQPIPVDKDRSAPRAASHASSADAMPSAPGDDTALGGGQLETPFHAGAPPGPAGAGLNGSAPQVSGRLSGRRRQLKRLYADNPEEDSLQPRSAEFATAALSAEVSCPASFSWQLADGH